MATQPRYGGAAYGGRTTAVVTRGAGAILVPGFDAAYYVTSRGGGTAAYGRFAYGGRRDLPRPAAGLFAVPDPVAGTITIPWWWAFADSATVARIDPDGSRVPVRGGEGATPAGPSRRNPSSNPSARDSLDGYAAGTNSTLSRRTGLTTAVDGITTAPRVTAAAAGAVYLTATLDYASPVPTTYGFAARTSAAATALGVSVTWYDNTSTGLGTQTYQVPAAARTAAAAGSTWTNVTVDSAPSGTAYGVLSYYATGLPAAGWLEVTARLAEGGTALSGPYFDGDSYGAAWLGTPGASYSGLGQINTLVDAEAPLDQAVAYELTSPSVSGWVARTEPVTLSSDDVFALDPAVPSDVAEWDAHRRALLTHPGQARTIGVWVERAPKTKNTIDQTAHKVPGRRNKVVYSADEYDGDEGELTFVCETAAERAGLRQVLDGSPLLLRSPAEYGYPPVWWLSFGDIDTEPLLDDARHPVRKLTMPFVEVDRPAVATRALAA